MRATEVGGGGILANLHNCAPNGARSTEMIEQGLPLTASDRARQSRKIFLEASKHLQHRVLVGEEYIPPHGRIGGRDAGEIAEASGGESQNFRAGDLAQLVRGANDGVGNEVRQMAGDSEHEVMVL